MSSPSPDIAHTPVPSPDHVADTQPAASGATDSQLQRDAISPGPSGGGVQVRRGLQRYALLIALVLLGTIFSIAQPTTFLALGTFTTMLSVQATAAMLALGITVVLLVGEFDLSVASTMGLSGSVLAYLTTQQSVSIVWACLVVLAISIVIGLVNAFFVVRVGVHSFIVTLGMGTLVQGVAIGIAGSSTIGGLSESFTGFFQTSLGGIQLAFFYMLVIAAVAYVVIARMPLGRKLFFTGNARQAAALAGIHTKRLVTGSFLTASVIACLCGILLVGQTGAVSPTAAGPYLLPAYAAGFLGATAFTPGRFNIWGSVWAVFFLAVGTTGFQLVGFDNWIIDVFNGAVLVAAVALARVFSSGKHRRRLTT